MKHGKSGQIYNFGNIEHVTNLDLVRRILSLLGISEEAIEFVPDRLGHDFRYAISAERALEELHWKPEYSLKSSLLDTINYYR